MALACPTATLQTGKDGGSVAHLCRGLDQVTVISRQSNVRSSRVTSEEVQLVSHSANGDCADRIWVSVPMGLPFLARRCESVLDSAAFLANTV